VPISGIRLSDWFHREAHGERDDLMSATRYAIMSLRHARAEDARCAWDAPIAWPEKGFV
jgi:hypothetical protein